MTMKILKTSVIALAMVLASACTLDLREDPNAVQLDQIDVNLSLNSVQTQFAGFFSGASGIAQPMVRLTNSGGSRYNNVFTPTSFDGIWGTAYSGFLQDATKLTEKADASGFNVHSGISRVLSAYVLATLVDYFGDVPYTEALQGSDNFNPAADTGESIYEAAIALLDRAIVDFNTSAGVAAHPVTAVIPQAIPTNPPFADLYYNGDIAKWKKLANTLKIKLYLNTGNKAGIEATLAAPDGIITAANQNFIFRYGTNTTDPDVRHPNFAGAYISGGGTYMSNYLVWQMLHGYDFHLRTRAGDPRMRFYFYRQTGANSTNPNEMRCVTELTPLHYPFATDTEVIYAAGGVPPAISTDPASVAWTRTYCYPSGIGYWGRDHVDNQGIPPDAFLRSTWGPYPSGGRFDANVNGSVAASQGMKGAGFQPIMMRSYVQFMLAEAVNRLSVTSTTTEKQYFTNGMNYSFTDVRDWSVNGTYGTNAAPASAGESVIGTFYTSADYTTDVTAYVTAATAAYDAAANADAKLNFIAREYWIALFGNGVEAYNMYRRTGKPTGMQPTLDPQPGAFPRSWWYPQTYVTLNNKADQKADLTTKVFWDNGAANLDF